MPVDDPIGASAKADLKQYLTGLGATSEEDDTFIYVPLTDVAILRLGISDFLESDSPVGITFEYDILDLDLAEVLFKICRIGGLVVRSGVDEEPVAVVKEHFSYSLDSRWKNIEIICHAEDVFAWMKANLVYKS
ncbi:MAG: hypothetical protein AAGA11_22245 [Pseudomonadota bacterium]